MAAHIIHGHNIGDETMKNLTALTSIIALVGALGWGASVAGPAGKAAVMHCGCNLTGTEMVYTKISISSKSRGHDAHMFGTIDSCFDGDVTYTDMVRAGNDCQLSGPPLGDPIDDCDSDMPPMEGAVCGMAEQ